MTRLISTKAIFNGRLQTTYSLLVKTDLQITKDYHDLNIIRGRLLRASRPETLSKIQLHLTALASSMGHHPPSSPSKSYLLRKINVYKKQNSYLRFAATQQAVVNICVIYEDFVKRIVMKYYEENIRRLPAKKQSVTNKELVDAILRKDNLHHTLAEKVTSDLMYGSVNEWHAVLMNQKIQISTSQLIKELFLVRNCIVHNNSRVSAELHSCTPGRYYLRKSIKLTPADVKLFKDEVYRTATQIIREFSRVHPNNRGTWLPMQ